MPDKPAYEIITMEPQAEYQPPTEPELWAQMIAGDISPAVYQLRAARLQRWPGYARFERRQT